MEDPPPKWRSLISGLDASGSANVVDRDRKALGVFPSLEHTPPMLSTMFPVPETTNSEIRDPDLRGASLEIWYNLEYQDRPVQGGISQGNQLITNGVCENTGPGAQRSERVD